MDPERDPRPRVLVAAFTGVMLSAGRHWGLRDGVSLEEARRVTQEHVEQLGPALSANWSRDEASRRA